MATRCIIDHQSMHKMLYVSEKTHLWFEIQRHSNSGTTTQSLQFIMFMNDASILSPCHPNIMLYVLESFTAPMSSIFHRQKKWMSSISYRYDPCRNSLSPLFRYVHERCSHAFTCHPNIMLYVLGSFTVPMWLIFHRQKKWMSSISYRHDPCRNSLSPLFHRVHERCSHTLTLPP